MSGYLDKARGRYVRRNGLRPTYLACGHVALFHANHPKVNDVIWCHRCRGTRIVVSQKYFEMYVDNLGPAR